MGRRREPQPRDAVVVSIGGGLSSFALVDRLRIGGVQKADIRVVSSGAWPWEGFQATCRASGMLDDSPLRSDSSSRMDNIWGFPGYAMTQALRDHSPLPMLKTLGEPLLNQPYTPPLGLFTDTLEREARRIGWPSMLVRGQATAVDRLPDGRYRVLVRRQKGRPMALTCTHLHLGLGATGPRVAEDAGGFRAEHGAERVVHAYEPHDHVYRELAARGGSVLLRGNGIAASRALHRLIQAKREGGVDLQIWHVFRSYRTDSPQPGGPEEEAHDAGLARTGDGFRYQPFSFPKGAFSGQLLDRTRALPEEERLDLLAELGATSTPYRREWVQELRQARSDGWYRAVRGENTAFTEFPDCVQASISLSNGRRLSLELDFAVDATGRNGRAVDHPLAAQLVDAGLAEANPLGSLRVDDDFVVQGSRGPGLLLASGMITRGAPLGPVDSFYGMQSAALGMADALAERGVGRRLGSWRSVSQWLRWVGGRQP
ncbi:MULTISPECIES: hypothetical protein [Arthrobacter]|uniref:FAD-dependent urate hydroxylase HpyO FAD/NAD(P)-binding domain-containing protein n=2 Tax=Arthrobacter TaxID=1663 RepID=A0ABU9KP84_9MICC|nr:hypothetical protein [Arthrobacter sp. YJM1]MDP5228728.1 hypothetical protein [Arthrobacter sp. YJM1]